MCSNWIIDGKWCGNGADLVEAMGAEKARLVNTFYDEIGKPGYWHTGPGGERVEHDITEQSVAESCLCWVDRDRMERVIGQAYEYACDKDAYAPLEKHDA